MKKFLIVTLLGLFIASCASRPDSISASYISHERFMGMSCSELDTKMADARASLTEFSDKQNTMANADAAGVFLVLVPVSQLSGDHEADIAKYKGIVEAIETAQIKSKCK